MRKTLIACVAATSLSLAAAGAEAAPLVISTPSSNAVFGPVEGWAGAPLYAYSDNWTDIYSNERSS